ncbi:MAG: hypothetical protein B6226_03720 [Candidatus Cloacimonetes bacterium 4572_65]|nr:MAG: hypothetical protein B6226_03720 [Candidatus Cloacimonetes bacterium 4572_65]
MLKRFTLLLIFSITLLFGSEHTHKHDYTCNEDAIMKGVLVEVTDTKGEIDTLSVAITFYDAVAIWGTIPHVNVPERFDITNIIGKKREGYHHRYASKSIYPVRSRREQSVLLYTSSGKKEMTTKLTYPSFMSSSEAFRFKPKSYKSIILLGWNNEFVSNDNVNIISEKLLDLLNNPMAINQYSIIEHSDRTEHFIGANADQQLFNDVVSFYRAISLKERRAEDKELISSFIQTYPKLKRFTQSTFNFSDKREWIELNQTINSTFSALNIEIVYWDFGSK